MTNHPLSLSGNNAISVHAVSLPISRKRDYTLRSYVQPEDDLHAAVARALRMLLLPPAVWTTLHVGGYALTGMSAARQVRLGVAQGWPDVLLVYQGQSYGIELKTKRGRLSRNRLVRTPRGGARIVVGQEERHAELAAAGMRLAVCRSVEEVLATLHGWGLPLRRWRVTA